MSINGEEKFCYNLVVAKNSTVHKYLFTVTPFSKALALSMFIVFPIIAFYLGVWYQKTLSSYQNPPVMLQTAAPTGVPLPTGCKSDSDCKVGEKCMVIGPLIANQPVRRVCVSPGQVLPQ